METMAVPSSSFVGPGTKWSKFLLNLLHQHQQSGLFCDTVVESSDGFIKKAHMCVLVAACPLLYPVVSCTDGRYVVKVPLTGADLKCVIEYIYTGELVNGPDYETSKAFQELGLSYLPSSEWSSYLNARLEQFQQAQLLCDVSLMTSDGDTLMAHACILSSTSPLFKGLFPGDTGSTFCLKTNVSASTLQFMLTYLYTGLMGHLLSYLQSSAGDGRELGSVYREFMVVEKSPVPVQVPVAKGRTITSKPATSVEDDQLPAEKSSSKADLPDSKKKVQASSKNVKKTVSKRRRRGRSGRKGKTAKSTSIKSRVSILKKKVPQKPEKSEASEEETPKLSQHKPSDSSGFTQKKPNATKLSKKSPAVRKGPLTCPVCFKEFKSKYRLDTHSRVHTGARPHLCSFCMKGFSSPHGVRVHEKLHTGDRPYVCDICGKSYIDGTSLRRHRRKHGNKTGFVCKQCGKALGDASALKCHELIHAGIRTMLCQICGKGFYTTGNLHTHMRIHTGEKPFACKFCDKRFSVSCSLRRHERLHTGEKPYQCKLCPKAFPQLTSLKLHMNKHATKFTCTVCQKEFTEKADFKRHVHSPSDHTQGPPDHHHNPGDHDHTPPVHHGHTPRDHGHTPRDHGHTPRDHAHDHTPPVLPASFQPLNIQPLPLPPSRVPTPPPIAPIEDYRCLSCNKTFTEPSYLRNHLDFYKGMCLTATKTGHQSMELSLNQMTSTAHTY